MEEEKEKIGQMNAKIIALVLKHTKIAILITTLTTIIYFRLEFSLLLFIHSLSLTVFERWHIAFWQIYRRKKIGIFLCFRSLFSHTNKQTKWKKKRHSTDRYLYIDDYHLHCFEAENCAYAHNSDHIIKSVRIQSLTNEIHVSICNIGYVYGWYETHTASYF